VCGSNLEICRQLLEYIPGNWDTFDIGVPLAFDAENGFIKYNSLVFLCTHAHQAFHKILSIGAREFSTRIRLENAYLPEFRPTDHHPLPMLINDVESAQCDSVRPSALHELDTPDSNE
jgi:hypothetical protein